MSHSAEKDASLTGLIAALADEWEHDADQVEQDGTPGQETEQFVLRSCAQQLRGLLTHVIPPDKREEGDEVGDGLRSEDPSADQGEDGPHNAGADDPAAP